MKGLLYRDHTTLLMHGGVFVWALKALLIFSGTVAWDTDLSFQLYYSSSILVSVLTMSLFDYDRAEGWDEFSATLPLTRGQVVTGRYLLTLIYIAVMTAFTLLASLLAWAFGQAASGAEALAVPTLLWCLSLTFNAIDLPILYRFGKWGRIGMTVVGIGGYLVVFALEQEVRRTSPGQPVLRAMAQGGALPLLAAAAVSLGVFELSRRLSIRWAAPK